MTPRDREEIENLAAQVCPHVYRGLPCNRDDHGPERDKERHWASGANGQGVNWPSEMSDQNIEQAAS